MSNETSSDNVDFRAPSAAGDATEHTNAPGSRALVLVLGMHRSGTSALTGMLGKLGVALGQDLMPPTQDNPKGYFENVRVVNAHEILFKSLDRAWHDPRPMPLGWTGGAAAEHARAALVPVVDSLLEESTVAAVKDPRGCLLVPLWLEVADQANARPVAILMVRHPDEVAGSLQRRDGLSRTRAHLLWMRYLLESERATRGVPRVFVSYDALLADWRAEMQRVSTVLGLDVPQQPEAVGEVERFLEASLRKHEAGRGRARATGPFADLAMELHDLARRCASTTAPVPESEFDAIARSFEKLAAGYLDAIEDSVKVETPEIVDREFERQHLNLSRVDAALQLAALRELWRPASIDRDPGPCKLYYRAGGEAFDEERTITAEPVVEDGWLQVEFVLPAAVRADYVRLDPDDAPGVFAVESVSLDGKPLAGLAARLVRTNEIRLPAMMTRAAFRFAALSDDPHFEIDLQDVGTAETGERGIGMRFRVETVASELGAQLHDVGLGLRRTQQQLQEDQQVLLERVAAIAVEARALGEWRSATDELWEQAATSTGARLDGLAAVCQAQQQELTGLRQELAGIRRDLAMLVMRARRRSLRYWWQRLRGSHQNGEGG